MITQLFRLIRKTLLTIVSSCLLLSFSGFAYGEPIGDIVENKGVTSVKRGDSRLETDVGTDINIYDEAETANGRMLIEFLDDEKLSLTENSLVYIDEAYYDPDPSLSKMSIRMVRGTSRFASGDGNRINKANVDVATPTANITMRGTDFTTTIDELGRTMVILLPDEETGASSGEILVWNDGGEVVLTEAYAATTVASFEARPTPSIVVNGITPSMINNMFIVNPPPAIRQAMEESYSDEQNQDSGMLDVDFLEFNELESDAKEAFGEVKDELKEQIKDVELPKVFSEIPKWHKIIAESDMAKSFSIDYQKFKNLLSDQIVEAIERGQKYKAIEYNEACLKINEVTAYFDEFFHHYDAILTPSACGEAPKDLKTTGNPIFCTIWTYCGMPSISLPLLQGKNKLPIGIQLVSSLYDDERLFRNATWLTGKIK